VALITLYDAISLRPGSVSGRAAKQRMRVLLSIRARRPLYINTIPYHPTLPHYFYSWCPYALRVTFRLETLSPLLLHLGEESGKPSRDCVHVAIAMPRNPASWDQYHYGSSPRGSVTSIGDRSVHFGEGGGTPPAGSPHRDIPHGEGDEAEGSGLRRRR
jgi:hypothetical protein